MSALSKQTATLLDHKGNQWLQEQGTIFLVGLQHVWWLTQSLITRTQLSTDVSTHQLCRGFGTGNRWEPLQETWSSTVNNGDIILQQELLKTRVRGLLWHQINKSDAVELSQSRVLPSISINCCFRAIHMPFTKRWMELPWKICSLVSFPANWHRQS